jgi:hypothetical protein
VAAEWAWVSNLRSSRKNVCTEPTHAHSGVVGPSIEPVCGTSLHFPDWAADSVGFGPLVGQTAIGDDAFQTTLPASGTSKPTVWVLGNLLQAWYPVTLASDRDISSRGRFTHGVDYKLDEP